MQRKNAKLNICARLLIILSCGIVAIISRITSRSVIVQCITYSEGVVVWHRNINSIDITWLTKIRLICGEIKNNKNILLAVYLVATASLNGDQLFVRYI